ncbi:MAG TPA: tetratricopeptide repeat protein, partial [Candidatus Obscuribacterales bacterium]
MKVETIADLEKFLAVQEQALGAESPEVAATLIKLANLHLGTNLDKAEALYRRAHFILEKT